ncbi:ankyrin repeat-containing domain protein [Neocallimastix lanati (nom. inval.)]|nr:ankyrin repeat-containing domain protein [Neocallimastix sp. JGI-2020a]
MILGLGLGSGNSQSRNNNNRNRNKNDKINKIIENCIEKDNFNKIKEVIAKCPNYKELDYNKRLLVTAIQKTSNNEIIKYFIDKEENLNYEIILGKTPLGEALVKQNFYIADILLKKGSNINFINSKNYNLLFYLKESKNGLNWNSIEFLIKNKIDFNWKNKQNMTFLDSIVEEENEKLAELFIKSISFNNQFIIKLLSDRKEKKGYSTEEFNNIIMNEYNKFQINNNVISNKIKDNSSSFVDLILKYKFATPNDETLNCMMHCVCKRKNIEFLKKLIDKNVNVNCKEKDTLITPLMDLCYYEKGLHRKGYNQCLYDMFSILFEAGAKINEKDANGKTALMYLLSTKKATVKLLKLLVQNGAKINDLSNEGFSPLFYACCGNNRYVIKYLLVSGANPDIVSKDGKTLFVYAAMNGCLHIVKYLMEMGKIKDINCLDENLETPLFYAVKNKYIQLTEYLLENGADVHYTNKNGEYPLIVACYERISKKKLVITQMLIDHGADVNKIANIAKNISYFYEIKYYSGTPLIYAIDRGSFDLVKLLVENGADVNKKNEDNNTPLYYSIYNKKPKIIEYLLNQGARINEVIGDKNETALFYAIRMCNVTIIRFLINNGADINHKNKDGNIPLSYISSYDKKKFELIEELINDDTDFEQLNTNEGKSLFHKSIETHNEILFNYIMDNKDLNININLEDSHHNTPLILACSSNNIDFVEKILEKNPNIDAKNDQLETALFKAVQRRNYKVMKLLTEHGALIDNSNLEINRLLLYHSIYSIRSVRHLVKYGLQINDYIINAKMMEHSSNLLSLAVSQRAYSSIQFLLANGANPFQYYYYYNGKVGQLPLNKLYQGKTDVDSAIKIIECFMEYNYDINTKDEEGETLLFSLYCHYNKKYKIEIMKYLIEKQNANVNVQTNNGATLLMALTKRNSNMNLDDIKLFVETYHCSTDIKDNYGNTVLIYALNESQPVIYNYFLNQCQDYSYKNNNGMNLLMAAVNNVNLDTVKKLVQKGIPLNEVDHHGRNALFYLYQPINCLPKVGSAYVMMLSTRDYGAKRDIFKYLVEEGMDINCENDEGETVLFYINDSEIMRYAVEHGADVTHCSHSGRTVLFNLNNLEMIKYVISKGADASVRDKEGHTAIYEKRNSDIQLVHYLLQNGADIKDFQFSCRSEYGFNLHHQIEFLKQALDSGLSLDTVNINDEEGKRENLVRETLLDYMINCIEKFEPKDFIDILMKAIDKKAFDIKRKNYSDCSPLLYFIKILKIKKVKNTELYFDLINSMLDYGAPLEEVDREGKTALFYSLEVSFNLMNQLLKRGAHLLIVKEEEKIIVNVKNILLQKNISDAVKYKIIETLQLNLSLDFTKKVEDIYPIFIAIEQKCYMVVKYLISKNASLTNYNDQKETVMDVAKRVDDLAIIKLISEQKEWIEFEKNLEQNKVRVEGEKEENNKEENIKKEDEVNNDDESIVKGQIKKKRII